MYIIGIDIGGTKCRVSLGEIKKSREITLLKKCDKHITKDYTPEEMLDLLANDISKIKKNLDDEIVSIGISCGGPLDSKLGIIMSPPNLNGWDDIYITKYFEDRFNISTYLCNDANACALAEWKNGAGRGTENMIFMTFGTGLGAGLILDGKLYSGTNDMAGELGHIRLSEMGPVGYGKAGSFEGFCSGGGIAQLAKIITLEEIQNGKPPEYCKTLDEIKYIDAEMIGNYAKKGEKTAVRIMQIVGEKLGVGLSILIDILNPEAIVIGSIFTRCYDEIYPYARRVIEKEALFHNRSVCKILKAELSEDVGDVAALTVASYFKYN